MQGIQPLANGLNYVHRSFSQVKQLRKCGFQFKLQRIDRVPDRPMVNAVAGTAVHSATEDIDHMLLEGGVAYQKMLDTANYAASAALAKEVERFEGEGWPVATWRKYPRQSFEWFRDTGIPNAIRAYLDWRIDNPDFELVDVPGFGPAIEVPFNYYIGDQLITGFIDRIFTSYEHGGYYPFDLKTGRKPDTDEQLGLYAQALHKALGWQVTWGYYLYQLKSGVAKMTPPLRVDHWNDEKLGQVYLPATRLIDLGIYIPSPGEQCQHCGVADACPFAQAVV